MTKFLMVVAVLIMVGLTVSFVDEETCGTDTDCGCTYDCLD